MLPSIRRRGAAVAPLARFACLATLAAASGTAASASDAPADERAQLRAALSFAATFDGGLDADLARGDGRLHWGPDWGPPRQGEPGIVPSGAVTRERSGALRGHALRFHRRTDELLFFFGDRNAPWTERDWNGAVSFWLRAEPQGELPDGFCDPVTVTSKDWNDAGLFCEFEKRPTFRHFRMGAYADLAVWNPTGKPWEQLTYDEKSLAGVEADAHFGGRYTHVVFVFERFNSGKADGVARLYLDGKLAAELSPRTQTWTWKAADQRIVLGLNYVGWLDELALFDRALSAAEVAALHALPGGLGDLLRPTVPVGAARVDVTPDFPVRLCGYASRDSEATGIAQRLYARALAVGGDDELALLMAVDNCAVPAAIRDEVAARLARRARLRDERFTLSSTHTHTGPWLAGSIDCMFGRPVPEDQLERVQRYTNWFVDRLEEAALAAIAARAPARLAFAEGRASFARNRRTAGGPTDPALPIVAAFGEDGGLRALVQNYACHCTTCGGNVNQHCGDWAGYASEFVEAAHAGAIALTVIGCGADANPAAGAGDAIETSKAHGRAIAEESERLLAGPMQPLLPRGGAPDCRMERFELAYDRLPTRDELAERAKRGDAVGYHAKWWLAKLDRGETMPATLPYSVQSWIWGDELAQLFLPGEVVVDYSLRLKRELDRARLWVSAYSNDVPCYIPSRRILAEGGYEAEGAMTYYGRPTRLAREVEERIVDAVKRLVPESFESGEQATRFPPPKSPAESLACIRVNRESEQIEQREQIEGIDGAVRKALTPAFDVELVASEPAIESPVAIDFGADGRVWVCEMNDYPAGLDGRYQPGGRVKWLRDRDGDGKYESSGLFLDGLPFPTGVMAWKQGVLICAAPDILYAEDTDGDGDADVKRVLFTGFSTENFQARVNSLTWGLDGWVWGSCGLFGGVITPKLPEDRGGGDGAPVDCRNRDFRIDPEGGVIEPVEGTSQQGRVRDDFGRWFGCDSGWLVFHYPLADRYVKRNPFVASPDPRWNLLDGADGDDPRALFQISPKLERFNDQGDLSRVTSACGVGIYRDTLLGEPLFGNAFTCEPVAGVVRRVVFDRAPGEVVPRGHRAPEERREQREFLASSDPWFRPVQATTGPDGALWIVDMYRFVIEHPRWIPAAKLAEMDVRAGANLGRIYRVVPKGGTLRPVQDLTKLPGEELQAAFVTDNGVVRDLAHRELLTRALEAPPAPETPKEVSLKELMEHHAEQSNKLQAAKQRLAEHRPITRAAITQQQAWLDEQRAGIGESMLLHLLDADWPVAARVQAMVLTERHFTEWPRLAEFIATAALHGPGPRDVPDRQLAFQAALSLGEWDSPRAGELLGDILVKHLDDPWMRAAVVSSATRHGAAILDAVLATKGDAEGRSDAVEKLVATAGALPVESHHEKLHVMRVLEGSGDDAIHETWRWRALGRLLGGMDKCGELNSNVWWMHPSDCPESNAPLVDGATPSLVARRRLDDFAQAARSVLEKNPVDPDAAMAALELVFHEVWPKTADTDRDEWRDGLRSIARFLDPAFPIDLQLAVLTAMERSGGRVVPVFVIAALPRLTPQVRSAALDLLSRKSAWYEDLLTAIEEGPVAKSGVDAAHRDRLLKHEDAAIRARAEKLFAPAGTPERAAVIEQFRPALDLKGASARGRATFARLCANCHCYRGIGHDVAPDLSAVGDRSAPRLLESILDPNAAVSADFVAYNVELANGDSLNGLIRGESSTGFTIVQASDLRRAVLRSEVAVVKPSKLSLMPEGLEEGLAPQDLADLIAFLQSSPAPLGAITDEQAAAARAALASEDAVAGRSLNGYARLVGAFDVFTQPTWFGPCTMHYCRQSDGQSKVTWRTQPVPADLAAASSFTFRFPAAIGFLSQPDGEFTLALDGRPLLTFDVAIDDARWSSPDGRASLDFECRAAHREDATGLMTLTIPADLLHPGQPAELQVTGSAAGSQRWFGLLAPNE